MKGLYAEKLFELECIKRGLKLLKPLDPVSRYDYALDLKHRIARIQVKSTNSKKKNRNNYDVKLIGQGNKKIYEEHEVDYFAVYIEPLNIWYVLPYEKVKGLRNISFYPNGRKSIYDPYRDNWAIIAPHIVVREPSEE